MKKLIGVMLSVALFSSVALGTTVSVSIQSGGSNSVSVAPGATVDYQVIAELSDGANEGLALIGLDLSFDGGPLSQAGEPQTGPMTAFVKPDGITNPAGYGGTEQGGVLRQVGGGQNTIMNGQVPCADDGDCPAGSTCSASFCTPVAAFPIGTVITGLAQPGTPVVVAEGSLTAPADGGPYTLSATAVFANVIKQFENGVPFWATEAADVAQPVNLTIEIVSAPAPAVMKWESFATHGGVGEVGLEIAADGTFCEPRFSGVSKLVVTFDGAIDSATAVPGNISLEGCDNASAPLDLSANVVATATANGDTELVITFAPKLPDFAKYKVTLNGVTGGGQAVTGGTSRVLTALLGDATGDRRVNASDVGGVRSFVGTEPIDPNALIGGIPFEVRSDANDDGRINATDLGGVRSVVGNDARGITCPTP